MFEWLEKEIATIKTPRFHLVDGPADGKLREAVFSFRAAAAHSVPGICSKVWKRKTVSKHSK